VQRAEVTPIRPGVSPKLDIADKKSPTAARNLAEQSCSFRVDMAKEPVRARFDRIDLRPRIGMRGAREMAAPPVVEVDADSPLECSVFIQLGRDLDPDRRRQLKERVQDICNRVRWKRDNAIAELNRDDVDVLRAIRGVSYIDVGQTLSAPRPVIGREIVGIPNDRRDVADRKELHDYGRDVLVGIIDVEGFDFGHEDFLDADGQTRWIRIWDQGGDGLRRPPPKPRNEGRDADRNAMQYGSEIREEHMDKAIRGSRDPRFGLPAALLEPQSQMLPGSHGTHVASIAAGNSGIARHAHIAGVLVELENDPARARKSFYDSTRIADGVEYLLDLAAELGGEGPPVPVSINISLGTNGHAHDGSSPMARWIDDALSTQGRCVTVAAGNSGQTATMAGADARFVTGRIHAAGTFAATDLRQELGWLVGADGIADVSDNEMEIWYSAQDRITVELRPPGGDWIQPAVEPNGRIKDHPLENGTVVSIYSELYHPANGLNRISIVLAPIRDDVLGEERPVAPGEWRVRLTGTVVRDGRYDAWIERDDPVQLGATRGRWRFPSYFAEGSYTSDRMINSLACAEQVIAVANVDSARNAAHRTSSRGPTRDNRCKPDIAAEGTNIVAARALGGADRWIEMTGTSMASPYVCGVAALMLAIEPKLTATQIQGLILTTSSPLAGHDYAWRNDTGFGLIEAAKCVDVVAKYREAIQTAEGDQ
jgi:subtilisin family serine protease